MYKKMKWCISTVTMMLIAHLTMQAQVTIGMDELPLRGALLDLKTQTDLTGGMTSDKGGLLFPRVKLQKLNDLTPFFAGGGNTIEKSSHKGLVVYNLTDNTSFVPGLYCWDGAAWRQQTTSGDLASHGVWNKVGTTKPSVLNTEDSYLMAKVAVNTHTVKNGAALTVNGNTEVTGDVNVSRFVRGGVATFGASLWAGAGVPTTGIQQENSTSIHWNNPQLAGFTASGYSQFVNQYGTGAGGFHFYAAPHNTNPNSAHYVASIDARGNLYIKGTLTQSSDRRIKTNVQDIQSALSKIMQLHPVSYDRYVDYRADLDGSLTLGDKLEKNLGFIAQEAEAVVPTAVSAPDSTRALYSMDYIQLIPLLTKAIQEQQEVIDQMRQELDALKK